MYDIATKGVNKLSGELSTAFVKVAEENAAAQDLDSAAIFDSGIVEQVAKKGNDNVSDDDSEATTTVPEQLEDYESDMDMERDMDSSAEASEPFETVVKFEPPSAVIDAGKEDKKQVANQVMISSGYSVIKS